MTETADNEKEFSTDVIFTSGTTSTSIIKDKAHTKKIDFVNINYKEYGNSKAKSRRVKYVIQED